MEKECPVCFKLFKARKNIEEKETCSHSCCNIFFKKGILKTHTRVRPTIKLICKGCKIEFDKSFYEHKRQIKRGKDRFYCNLSCALKNNKLDDLSPFRKSFTSAKKHSKAIDKEITIILEDLKNVWDKQKGICPYTNIKMKLGHCCNIPSRDPDYASLDRIDSDKGYTIDNVEFVCLFVNYGKSDFTQSQIKDFFKNIYGSKTI